MRERIAIIGYAGLFPQAEQPDQFWHHLREGIDTARRPPQDRWLLPPETVFHPQPGQVDHVYSLQACFLDPFTPDLTDLAIEPALVAELDPLFQLCLHIGNRAFRSAQLGDSDRSRIGVVLGNIALPTDRASDWARQILGGPIESALGRPIFTGPKVHPWNRYVAGLPAGLLAQALRLGKGSFTLDAACASSLYALKWAADELLAGRADVMLAGGMSRPDSLYTQMGFAQLRALSKSGRCSPFDRQADGLIVGEGGGIFVLKRLSDAIRDGNSIHAVLCGFGLSNDVAGNLLAPASEGQLRAMRAAYADAQWQPDEVDHIECHATGTPVGDATEFASLQSLWSEARWQPQQCVIGCVKSTVGHLLTGAGAAGLMKTLLALKHETLPPTANFREAPPQWGMSQSPFRVLTQAEPWLRRAPQQPRRAAVSAFGFGGINAHVLVEEWLPQANSATVSVPTLPPEAEAEPAAEPAIVSEPLAIVSVAVRLGTPQIEELTVPVQRFRIPPTELREMLPQQTLMLEVAADALDAVCAASSDSGEPSARTPENARGVEGAGGHPGASDSGDPLALRTGVFIGLGLDLNTTNFHLRWATRRALGEAADPAFLDAVSPPLTANRTMGALGSIAASRIARAFHFGGPSFTLCAEDASGLRALERACRALQQREIDRALVGAVDLACDPRSASTDTHPQGVADAAVALVVKRYSDAQRDGDRIEAVVVGLGVATQDMPAAVQQATMEAGGPSADLAVTQRANVGFAGAASGLIDLAEACRRLRTSTWPTADGSAFWLHDTADGLRRTLVTSQSVDGNCVAVVLQEAAQQQRSDADAYLVPLAEASAEMLYAFEADSVEGLLKQLEACDPSQPPNVPTGKPALGLACVARSAGELREQLQFAIEHLRHRPQRLLPDADITGPKLALRDRLFWTPEPMGHRGKLAFVFPGSGNHFAGMGRDLSLRWPKILQRQQAENRYLRSQYAADGFWFGRDSEPLLPRELIFGQVSLGTLVADLLRELGVEPEVCLGYSLGTSASFFGLRAWTARDEMLQRLQQSTLFVCDLAGPYNAARRFWNLDDSVPIDWRTGVVNVSADAIRERLRPELRAYLLIINTAKECVIGGLRADLETLLGELQANFLPIEGVTLAHCEVASPVAEAYRALHDLPTTPPRGVQFYDAVWTLPYRLTQVTAANVMTSALLHTIDFATTVHNAYRDGTRYFVEIGPGASCTRMIEALLVGRQYRARAVCVPRQDAVSLVLRLLAQLHSERRQWNFTALQQPQPLSLSKPRPTFSPSVEHSATPPQTPTLTLPVGFRFGTFPSSPTTSVPRVEPPRLEPHPSQPSLPTTASPRPSVVEPSHQPTPTSLSDPTPLTAAATPRSESTPTLTLTSTAIPAATPPAAQPTTVADIAAISPITHALQVATQTQLAVASAHEAFLRFSTENFDQLNRTLAWQTTLLQALVAGSATLPTDAAVTSLVGAATVPTAEVAMTPSPSTSGTPALSNDGVLAPGAGGTTVLVPTPMPPATPTQKPRPQQVPRSLDTADCFEFARGKIADVLGDTYAEVDTFPTRVRLPDGPLMLVDRVVHIEGEPRSLGSGRVITEHRVHAGRWYLDAGRIPTCIAVESGQADLFLSGFLGIDFQTKGLACYRLLDAVVTFHRSLPGVGALIRYDIRIDQFFRQGSTYLFRFRFEATVDGEPLLTMTDGCAGFFTAAELAAGKGIIHTELDRRPIPGVRPADWHDWVPMSRESLSTEQVEALRQGDLVKAFGPAFARAKLSSPMRLPGGMLRLVDRVRSIDPQGGRYGLGQIVAEFDIHPDDWFLTCHFVDDQVMPGTLMYECCLHTLRIYLMRLGWVGEEGEVVCEPIPGRSSRLKCRGQVIASTKVVSYEVTLKELGYGPEPFAICDALMYADGKPIVEITGMTLRLTGLTRAKLEAIWGSTADAPTLVPVSREGTERYDRKPALFDTDRITAFAIGNPSEAFGDRYRVFDRDRVIARLPGPPYQFLDRITAIRDCQPWQLQAGGVIEAQYDVPVDAWYFEANRCDKMPFCVLLEVALQPCGWLAAYLGSALTSEVDLSFRNLGGQATQYREVGREVGTLTTEVKITKVSQSVGMIIQHYDFRMTDRRGVVYEGNTYFGFFSKAALANQVGLREAAWHEIDKNSLPWALSDAIIDSKTTTGDTPVVLPSDPPFPAAMLRMVDRIDYWLPQGGSKGLGLVQGRIAVDPSAWFFRAHFYQDPVWPGSLGLESLLQLLKFVAWKRWQRVPPDGWQTVALHRPHQWIYRGQVIPTDHEVTVQADITTCDEEAQRLTANGFLRVDGRVIYEMKDFSLE